MPCCASLSSASILLASAPTASVCPLVHASHCLCQHCSREALAGCTAHTGTEHSTCGHGEGRGEGEGEGEGDGEGEGEGEG